MEPAPGDEQRITRPESDIENMLGCVRLTKCGVYVLKGHLDVGPPNLPSLLA